MSRLWGCEQGQSEVSKSDGERGGRGVSLSLSGIHSWPNLDRMGDLDFWIWAQSSEEIDGVYVLGNSLPRNSKGERDEK